jgi:hypothetical protein
MVCLAKLDTPYGFVGVLGALAVDFDAPGNDTATWAVASVAINKITKGGITGRSKPSMGD